MFLSVAAPADPPAALLTAERPPAPVDLIDPPALADPALVDPALAGPALAGPALVEPPAFVDAPGPTDHHPDRRDEADELFVRLGRLPPGGPEHHHLRDQLVTMHLPLVTYFARRYAGRGEPLDDLVQAGSVGLVNAVDRFEVERGIAFSTYAAPTILGEIRRHFRDRTWSVHVNRSLQVRTVEVDRHVRDLGQELGRSPTVRELCARSGLTEGEVLESLQCHIAYRARSLDSPVPGNRTLGDLLGGEDSAYEQVELHESLAYVLSRLPERERRILQLRFYGNMTQSQIAGRLGISQMHVSRLLNRTLARLRRELAAEN